MLKINKIKEDNNTYRIEIIFEDKILVMYYGNNLDLYWYIKKNSGFSFDDINKTESFTITKDDYYLYSLFNKLYESIKANKVLFKDEELFKNNNTYVYNKIFKQDHLEWISDESLDEKSNILNIIPIEDGYKLEFTQKYNEEFFYSIRFSNDGSRYAPFNINFMQLYDELQSYNAEDYEQINFDEYLYNQKKLTKK